MTITILSWNIMQGGGRRMSDICSSIEVHSPDILVLQEYRRNKSAALLQELLVSLGLSHQYSAPEGPSDNCVLVASHFAFQASSWTADLPQSKAIHARMQTGSGARFDVLAAHFPHKKMQLPYFGALLDGQIHLQSDAVILGDLNCGIPFEDSETKTFENTHLFQSLLKANWTDSWRSRHQDIREFSWISHRGNGYRYDHCLVTATLDSHITEIRYLHELREQRLSDHSALLLTLSLDG